MTKQEILDYIDSMLNNKPADISGDAWVAILELIQTIVNDQL